MNGSPESMKFRDLEIGRSFKFMSHQDEVYTKESEYSYRDDRGALVRFGSEVYRDRGVFRISYSVKVG